LKQRYNILPGCLSRVPTLQIQSERTMPDFTHTLLQAGNPLEFRFTRIDTSEGQVFFIGVMGRNHRSYSFLMKQHGSNWKIVPDPTLPPWLLLMETELSKVISQKS